MQRLFVLAGVVALAVLVAGVRAEDKDDKEVKDDKKDEKPKNIKAFMKKAHAGDEAFKSVVTKAAKDKEYDTAATALKAWVAISGSLSEFDPPKGEKEDWAKLSKKYAEDVKALAKAVDDKDDKAIAARLKTINSSCGGCHKSHKGK